MRVFLFNSKVLSEINRKEEMTDDTYLITDREAELIQANLDNNGYFWIDENKQLRLSGKKPNDYSNWDNQEHKWVEDETQKTAYINTRKAEIWELIKKKREQILQSGVNMIIDNKPKWFHTDIISQQSYDRAKDYLKGKSDEKIHWKTMDNSFVELSFKDLKDLTDHIFITGQTIFSIAEQKRAELNKLTDPTLIDSFDIGQGWVEVFNLRNF